MPSGTTVARTLLALVIALTLGLVAGVGNGPIARASGIACAAATLTTAGAAATTPTATGPADVVFPEDGGDLTVFAAASLTDGFDRIKADLEAAHPGLTIAYNFAGSPALVTQLSEGAEADVFASASNAQMKAAMDKGVIEGSATVFTQNRLAIVVPKDNPAGITGLADLAKDGVKLVLAQAEVPVGMYARQSICTAAGDTATYGTAEVAPDVMQIEIPAAVNVIATYPIAAVKGGNMELAAAFIAYVLGPDGQATLQTFGFEPKP